MSEGLFSRLRRGLQKTSRALGLGKLFRGPIDEDLLEELEDRLIMADMGPAWVSGLIDQLEEARERGEIEKGEDLGPWIRQRLLSTLAVDKKPDNTGAKPGVWFFLGVNGVGKTTSLGKLGKRLSENGFDLLFAAGDTFRAAAGEQLQLWGERAGATVIRHREGGDPSAVVFDACEAASTRDVDLLLVDTAGRLHNKKNLMNECSKMFRTAQRQGAEIEEVFLVLDASTGQNAVQQAKLFNEVAPLTGLILTKMDGSAKGGVIFQLVAETGAPVRYIGIGEAPEDLMDFDPESFVDAILSEDET